MVSGASDTGLASDRTSAQTANAKGAAGVLGTNTRNKGLQNSRNSLSLQAVSCHYRQLRHDGQDRERNTFSKQPAPDIEQV